jgi:hypothetical protein
MIGLIRKSDSDGQASYCTIVGINMDDCECQSSELNRHARTCGTGNRFTLIATRQTGVWYDIEGRRVSDEYIRPFLK